MWQSVALPEVKLFFILVEQFILGKEPALLLKNSIRIAKKSKATNL